MLNWETLSEDFDNKLDVNLKRYDVASAWDFCDTKNSIYEEVFTMIDNINL